MKVWEVGKGGTIIMWGVTVGLLQCTYAFMWDVAKVIEEMKNVCFLFLILSFVRGVMAGQELIGAGCIIELKFGWRWESMSKLNFLSSFEEDKL